MVSGGGGGGGGGALSPGVVHSLCGTARGQGAATTIKKNVSLCVSGVDGRRVESVEDTQ